MSKAPTYQIPINQNEVNGNVIKYYHDMTFIYELLWGKKGDLSLHTGFWENGIKSQKEANLNENLKVAEALKLESGDIVLDAGCGVCGPAVWMAKQYGCNVTGITISSTQIKRATKYINEHNIRGKVSVELKDFCNTGYPNESFSKIYAIESSCYALNKAEFVKEMYNLLKPGGRIAIVDGYLSTWDMDPKIKEQYEDFLRGFAVPSGITINEFKILLENAGFKEIKIEDKTENVLPSTYSLMKLNKAVLFPTKLLYKFKIIPNTIYLDTITNCSLYSMYKERHFLHLLISAVK